METDRTDRHRRAATLLRRKVQVALGVVSVLPLALTGVGAWVVFGGLLEERAMELQRQLVVSHAASIEAHLEREVDLLRLLAEASTVAGLTGPGELERAFEALDVASRGGFVDLGVIAPEGRHLAYVGPYELADRNYRDADWFREVMVRGSHVSDVFLGFRNVPHLVVAVRVDDRGRDWVLRATLESVRFESLVATDGLGRTGDAYLVDAAGVYQTSPAVGSVLDRADLPFLERHTGVRSQVLELRGERRLVVTTWVNRNRWLLVVERSLAEVRAPLARAMTLGGAVVAVAFAAVLAGIVVATRVLWRQIDRANRQRDDLSQAFMRSARLASVGELATGLAHEINNPLAIISAEHTNLADLLAQEGGPGGSTAEVHESLERIRRQVRRCAGITSKMLQFGRQRESRVEPTAVDGRLEEVAGLMERQAAVRNVELRLEVAPELPRAAVDPLELEQVLVNLVTNGLDAMPDGGRLTLRARAGASGVVLEVSDTGAGMPSEVRERVFEPFFTTKPVGAGTGLGLSVCYGLVAGWGGRIEADSEPGRGTTMRLHLRRAAASDDHEEAP